MEFGGYITKTINLNGLQFLHTQNLQVNIDGDKQ